MTFCPDCGAKLPDGSRFCSVCGATVSAPAANQQNQQPAQAGIAPPQAPVSTPIPAPIQQPAGASRPQTPAPEKPAKAKKTGSKLPLGIVIGALAMAAVFALMSVLGVISFGKGGKAAGKIEGSGYDTPEAAARACAEAYAAGDVDAIVSTFAIETYVENVDNTAYLTETKTASNYTFNSGNLVWGGEYGKALSAQLRRGSIEEDLSYHMLTLAFYKDRDQYEDFLSSLTILLREESEAREFAAHVDAGTPKSIRLVEIWDAARTLQELGGPDYEKYIQFFTRNMSRYSSGAEQARECCVILEIDGARYGLCLYQACYNGRWYNVSFTGPLCQYIDYSFRLRGLLPLE